jgi:glycine dehydrogenase
LFEQNGINLRHVNADHTGVSLDETVSAQDLQDLISIFGQAKGQNPTKAIMSLKDVSGVKKSDPNVLRAEGQIFKSDIFRSVHGEHEMMRYLKFLENKDVHLTKSMISLGSCTMKLNSATEMIPLTWPELNLHPYVPRNQTEGYLEFIGELKKDLQVITNYDDFSFQPNSGATGEYAGLLSIRAYQDGIGQGHRNICLIPTSAHGTNPASAVKCGLEVVTTASDEAGNICLVDLKAKCEKYKDNLSCFMITYPSTHGVYEDTVRPAIDMIHSYGGQVYLDGANMNA